MATPSSFGCRKHGRIHDEDIGEHVVVDVAAEHDNAIFIETDGRVRVPLVDGQLELVWVRERVHVVRDNVAVRELDQRSGLYDEQCGTKRCSTWSMMALVPAGAEAWRCILDVHGDAGHRLSFVIEHGDAHFACMYGIGEADRHDHAGSNEFCESVKHGY